MSNVGAGYRDNAMQTEGGRFWKKKPTKRECNNVPFQDFVAMAGVVCARAWLCTDCVVVFALANLLVGCHCTSKPGM